jgi:bifunctional non-homologous end joining protein LigD
VIVQGSGGRCDFHALRAAIRRNPGSLVFMAFDLLHLDGRDLRREPIEHRRARLGALLGANRPESPLQFSAEHVGDGAEFFAEVDRMGLEGIVSKRLGSRYQSGRSKHWLKTKTFEAGEFVVIGVEQRPGQPTMALLAREEAGELVYAGAASVTLREADRERFWRAIEELQIKQPAIVMDPREAQWVKPRLRLTARYLKNEEKLRHATLTGLVG